MRVSTRKNLGPQKREMKKDIRKREKFISFVSFVLINIFEYCLEKKSIHINNIKKNINKLIKDEKIKYFHPNSRLHIMKNICTKFKKPKVKKSVPPKVTEIDDEMCILEEFLTFSQNK